MKGFFGLWNCGFIKVCVVVSCLMVNLGLRLVDWLVVVVRFYVWVSILVVCNLMNICLGILFNGSLNVVDILFGVVKILWVIVVVVWWVVMRLLGWVGGLMGLVVYCLICLLLLMMCLIRLLIVYFE